MRKYEIHVKMMWNWVKWCELFDLSSNFNSKYLSTCDIKNDRIEKVNTWCK